MAFQQRGGSRTDRFPANGLHWLLGLIRLGLGDVDDARREFERELVSRGSALYAAEYAMDAHDGHGFACLAMGEATQAVAMFTQALAIYPDHARSLAGLAAAARLRGDEMAARAALDRARLAIGELAAHGRSAEAAMASSLVQVVEGRPLEAIATLRQLLEDAPPGFAGWTIPVEPLLTACRALPAYREITRLLAERAL